MSQEDERVAKVRRQWNDFRGASYCIDAIKNPHWIIGLGVCLIPNKKGVSSLVETVTYPFNAPTSPYLLLPEGVKLDSAESYQEIDFPRFH